ncbi:uncharacterized protein LOC116133551 [Pistacia vera]|uniref:uncharacterized protein LOC116133551 n=1 Tax=Pistacia vera TaxID=55513 RepID=UPI001262B81D|nr:uncharacterized protein LOC116133551 [Pistacia vera]
MSRQVLEGKISEYQISADVLSFRSRICIPQDAELRKKILTEAHDTPYTAHPIATKMYVSEPSHILKAEEMELEENLVYEEFPIQILDKKVIELRNKSITLVKVLYRNHTVEEATWEVEQDVSNRYPKLFS